MAKCSLHLQTPVSHPPSQEQTSAAMQRTRPKNTFASIKNREIWQNYFLNKNQSEKEFNKLTFGNSEFVTRLDIFTSPTNINYDHESVYYSDLRLPRFSQLGT